MFNPIEIVVNPDRPNISFSSSARPDRGDEKLNDILRALVDQLKGERMEFPLTFVFGNLETISMCYAFFNFAMGKEQYEPVGAPSRAENRLFTQFHAQYPAKEKERIVEGLTLGTSKLRIIFATVAFGIGLYRFKEHQTNHSHWCPMLNGGILPGSWTSWERWPSIQGTCFL